MNIFTVNCTVYPYIYVIPSEPTVGSVFRFRSVPIELRIKINDAPAHAFYRTARRANADERHTERHTTNNHGQGCEEDSREEDRQG